MKKSRELGICFTHPQDGVEPHCCHRGQSFSALAGRIEQDLSSNRLRAESRRIDRQPGVKVELKAAVGFDVAVDQGRDSPSVVGVEGGRLGQSP